VALPGEPETLDRSVVNVLLELGADIPGFSDELVGDFTSAVARHTAGMRAAVRSGSGQALGFAAHALRGSCGIIGARRMARLCDEIEEAADADRVAAAAPGLDETVSAAKAKRA
jgi:HPt (histidine-containing phosphotransfer) domain-containing protein